jgi:hypothetical protein
MADGYKVQALDAIEETAPRETSTDRIDAPRHANQASFRCASDSGAKANIAGLPRWANSSYCTRLTTGGFH